jgi:hypothetical protein
MQGLTMVRGQVRRDMGSEYGLRRRAIVKPAPLLQIVELPRAKRERQCSALRKARNVTDAIRSPAREGREICVGTFSLRSRSGLPSEIVIIYGSGFVAIYTGSLEGRKFDYRKQCLSRKP